MSFRKVFNRLISTSCKAIFAFKFSFAISITFFFNSIFKEKRNSNHCNDESKSVIPPHLNIFLAIFIVFTIIFYRGQRYKIILNCYNRSTNKTASSTEIIFTMVLEGRRSPVVIASNSCIVPRTLMVTFPLPCLYSGIGI